MLTGEADPVETISVFVYTEADNMSAAFAGTALIHQQNRAPQHSRALYAACQIPLSTSPVAVEHYLNRRAGGKLKELGVKIKPVVGDNMHHFIGHLTHLPYPIGHNIAEWLIDFAFGYLNGSILHIFMSFCEKAKPVANVADNKYKYGNKEEGYDGESKKMHKIISGTKQ